jgi:hypothetical protein
MSENNRSSGALAFDIPVIRTTVGVQTGANQPTWIVIKRVAPP